MLPAGLDDSLARFRERHPDPSTTGFLMMRFRGSPAHKAILDSVRSAFADHEMNLLRADDFEFHPELFTNVLTYMHGCGFGVAIFDRIDADEFNPNVALEVGYMMALQKPLCFLKDTTLRALHADIISRLYIDFNTFSPSTGLSDRVKGWIEGHNLCASTRQCHVHLDAALSDFNETSLFSIAACVGVLVSGAGRPKFKGVGEDAKTGHTVLKYDASVAFIERLRAMHHNGDLANLAQISIVQITSDIDGDRDPRLFDIYQNLDTRDMLFQYCFLQEFEGLQAEADEARRVLPPLTNNPAECAIYVTEKDDWTYFHSNFLQRGRLYPTKLIVHRHRSLKNIYIR